MKSLKSFFAVALVAFAGCQTPIGVNSVGFSPAYAQISANILTADTLSGDTLVVLNRYGLAQLFAEAPDLALARLHDAACKDNRRDVLFALAEASYAAAEHYQSATWSTIHREAEIVTIPGKRAARAYYCSSAIYAYLYLFGEGMDAAPDPYNSTFRLACDFYNRGLAQALQDSVTGHVNLTARTAPLPMGSVPVTIDRTKFPWTEAQFHEFIAADDMTVRGLNQRPRGTGLGAPLIAIPNRAAFGTKWPDYYSPGIKVPVTAVLRVKGTVRDMASGGLSASVALYSAYDTRAIEIGQKHVPLETDMTAALAYGLQHSIQWKARMVQFMSGRELIKNGIYLTAPYQRGKIPVVFVYGTGGSPSDWASAFDTLHLDPAISARYQFWFFTYNSGNPIAYSGWQLRSGIAKVVHEIDPESKDEALRQIVIIGHSQGGLITKLAAVDSGNKFATLVTDRPLSELKLTPDNLKLLENVLLVEHSPYVRRVILACAPNEGSILVNNWARRFSFHLITLPQNLVGLGADLATLNLGDKQEAAFKQLHGGMPNSVVNMQPGNPFLVTLHDLPLAGGITGNIIIGKLGDRPFDVSDDSVVACPSARLPGMESEFISHVKHGKVPADPLAVEEIRRILLLHLPKPN